MVDISYFPMFIPIGIFAFFFIIIVLLKCIQIKFGKKRTVIYPHSIAVGHLSGQQQRQVNSHNPTSSPGMTYGSPHTQQLPQSYHNTAPSPGMIYGSPHTQPSAPLPTYAVPPPPTYVSVSEQYSIQSSYPNQQPRYPPPSYSTQYSSR